MKDTVHHGQHVSDEEKKMRQIAISLSNHYTALAKADEAFAEIAEVEGDHDTLLMFRNHAAAKRKAAEALMHYVQIINRTLDWFRVEAQS